MSFYKYVLSISKCQTLDKMVVKKIYIHIVALFFDERYCVFTETDVFDMSIRSV